ncbi:uncharacterized protein TNCV_3215291 [Trichonephila clavipes]|nr:uncharacterized protein TNCV_3215291 [Trichonephila clavipes]
MLAYTRQTAKSKYRNRIRLERASREQSNGTTKTEVPIQALPERKRMNATKRINDEASTSAAGTVEIMQVDDEIAFILTQDCVGIDCVQSSFMKTHRVAASARFTTTFVNNPFGHKCDCLWFPRSLKRTKKNTYLCLIILSKKS